SRFYRAISKSALIESRSKRTMTVKEIIAYLRRLFGVDKDLARIVRPITKMQTELDQLAARETLQAADNREAAAKLLAEADQRYAEAVAARKFASNLPNYNAVNAA